MLQTLAHVPFPFLAVLEHRKDDAFGRDAAALRPLVRAVVASIVREPVDHPDVEDCTNETLRRAIEGQDRLREGEAVRPWVIGIARHVALDALRGRKRARARDAGGGADEGGGVMAPPGERLPDPPDDPFERVSKARRDATVRTAIEALPDGQRKALTMFHLEGLAYQEIAVRFDVPLGTVATWVMRGRKTVATAVQELARE